MNTAGQAAGRAPAAATAAAPAARACPRCGTRFECGAGTASCWCASLPPLDPLPAALPPECLCEACLREEIARC